MRVNGGRTIFCERVGILSVIGLVGCIIAATLGRKEREAIWQKALWLPQLQEISRCEHKITDSRGGRSSCDVTSPTGIHVELWDGGGSGINRQIKSKRASAKFRAVDFALDQ